MHDSLLHLWHKFLGWLLQRPLESHHPNFDRPYQPSNLHARHH